MRPVHPLSLAGQHALEQGPRAWLHRADVEFLFAWTLLLPAACGAEAEEQDESTQTESSTGESAKEEFRVRLEIEGLKGSGLRLRLGEDEFEIEQLGPPTPSFPERLQTGEAYAVELIAQPRWPSQSCVLEGSEGVVDGADVSVGVSCVLDTPAGLDSTFGAEGIVIRDDLGGIEASPDVPFNLLLTPDEELVVVGQALAPNEFDGVVWRLDADGGPALGFGEQGVQLFDNGAFETFAAAALGADGSVYAVGRRFVPMAGADLLVVHFLADGSLDPMFGEGGWVLYDNLLGGCPDQIVADNAMDMVSTPAGLLITGGSVEPDCEDTDAFIVRIDPATGALDPSYAMEGVLRTQSPQESARAPNDTGVALAQRADGRVWLAGLNTMPNTNDSESALLWRVEAEGTLDPSFASQQALLLSPDASAHPWSVAAVAEGGAFVVGEQHADSTTLVVWRVSEEGLFVPGFGEDGRLYLTNAQRYISSRRVALDSQGRLVILGTRNNLADDADLAVWRLLPDGAPDLSFGDEGLFVWDGGRRDVGYGLALDSSDRALVSASTVDSEDDAQMLLLRVHGSP